MKGWITSSHPSNGHIEQLKKIRQKFLTKTSKLSFFFVFLFDKHFIDPPSQLFSHISLVRHLSIPLMSSLTLVQQQNKKKTNESNKITASTPTLVVYSPCPFSWTLPHFLVYHFYFCSNFYLKLIKKSVLRALHCPHPPITPLTVCTCIEAQKKTKMTLDLRL